MSQNCRSTTYPSTRDANNNTLYHGGGTAPDYHNRGAYPPAFSNSAGYQQVTANVIFGSMSGMNELKMKEAPEKEVRRTH